MLSLNRGKRGQDPSSDRRDFEKEKPVKNTDIDEIRLLSPLGLKYNSQTTETEVKRVLLYILYYEYKMKKYILMFFFSPIFSLQ